MKEIQPEKPVEGVALPLTTEGTYIIVLDIQRVNPDYIDRFRAELDALGVRYVIFWTNSKMDETIRLFKVEGERT